MANGYDILDWVYVGIFGGGAALVFTVLALVKGFRFAHWLLLEIFRGPILLLIDAVAALGAHISKAVHLAFNRPSPDTFRRRDLISRYPVRHAYPSVISNKDESSLEKLLAIYGRYLNLKANIPCTNATVFRIRSWLQNCEKNHNGKDGRPPCHPVDDENRRGFPLWLIDIEQRCLVPYQYSMTYIALSYVWGNVETAQTLSSNLDCLRKPQSLLGPHAEVKLPITVSDAMFLTGFVGCRYLWCDRLCIVQDDAESKHSQIRQMAEIYARSFCTIIASDNLSANSGLHGIPNLSPKALEESTDVLDKTKFAWSARAWTFQEELFSTRLIWLSSGQVSWQCLGLHYPESSRRYNDSKHPNSRLLGGFDHLSRAVQIGGMLCPQSPEPHFYMALAKGFSRRFVNERYPEDRFHAFSSVELALEEVYPGVFIQCIPECIFSTCMLWSLDVSSSSRIQIKVGSSGKRSASWSWIDWSNSVNFSRLESRDFGGTCRSLVSWRHFEDISPAIFTTTLPPSTIREKSLCSYLHGRVGLAQFTLRRQCEHLGSRYFLLSRQDEKFAGVLENCDESHIGTSICLIAISSGSHKIKRRRMRSDQSASNIDAFSKEGWIHPNGNFDQDYLPSEYYYAPLAKSKMPCCHVQTELSSLILDEEYAVDETYEFYDALWIDWNCGIAYRRGLARVAKAVWERENLGWIDVTLG